MQHANARLTVHARQLLVQRVAAGWPQARVAEQLGVSRQTVSKWWTRFKLDGEAGLLDRPSTPRRCPTRTSAVMERRVLGVSERLCKRGSPEDRSLRVGGRAKGLA